MWRWDWTMCPLYDKICRYTICVTRPQAMPPKWAKAVTTHVTNEYEVDDMLTYLQKASTGLVWSVVFIGHLHLSSVWQGLEFWMDTHKPRVTMRLDLCILNRDIVIGWKVETIGVGGLCMHLNIKIIISLISLLELLIAIVFQLWF